MAKSSEETSTPKRLYRRLPGRGRKVSGCIAVGAAMSTIWLADDHLLVRESVYGMTETYKRFYFRDVQAIVIRRSARWIGWMVFWLTLCLVFIFFWGMNKQRWGWTVPSGLCFVFAVMQLIQGPTCVTHLVTAVQRELLGSLNRIRKVRRAFKTLVPLIEEKQGPLDLASLQQAAAAPGQPSVGQPRTVTQPSADFGSAAIPGQRARLSVPHLVLFLVTLAGGGVAFLEYFRPSRLSFIGAGVLLAGILVLSVVALVTQGRRRMNKVVSALTWTITISYIVAWLIIYSVYSTIYSVQRNALHASAHEAPELVSELSAPALRQMPGFDYVLLIYGGCSVALGLIGTGTLLLRRPRIEEPPPLPPPKIPPVP